MVLQADKVFAYTVEGTYNGVSYVARANGDAEYAYLKISSSRAATHTGTITVTKQAFLGLPCGHVDTHRLTPRTTTSHGTTYYVDPEHTILEASFVWYMNGTNIASHSMTMNPYRKR